MFGFSFGELLVISLVTLVAVGPQKLPGMLKTMGQWARKLRKMTMDVRQQTGIDEMLRAEGIQIAELRSLMRGYHGAPVAPTPAPAPAPAPVATTTHYDDPYADLEPDPTREYPLEGADAYGEITSGGTFVVKSYGGREGLRPGSYIAYIDPASVMQTDSSGKKAVMKPGLNVPVTFLKPETSKWKFEVGESKPAGEGRTLVETKLIRSNGEPVALNYLFRFNKDAWRVIDIYLSGSISQMAQMRSDFSKVVVEGGADALIASLEQKIEDLKKEA